MQAAQVYFTEHPLKATAYIIALPIIYGIPVLMASPNAFQALSSPYPPSIISVGWFLNLTLAEEAIASFSSLASWGVNSTINAFFVFSLVNFFKDFYNLYGEGRYGRMAMYGLSTILGTAGAIPLAVNAHNGFVWAGEAIATSAAILGQAANTASRTLSVKNILDKAYNSRTNRAREQLQFYDELSRIDWRYWEQLTKRNRRYKSFDEIVFTALSIKEGEDAKFEEPLTPQQLNDITFNLAQEFAIFAENEKDKINRLIQDKSICQTIYENTISVGSIILAAAAFLFAFVVFSQLGFNGLSSLFSASLFLKILSGLPGLINAITYADHNYSILKTGESLITHLTLNRSLREWSTWRDLGTASLIVLINIIAMRAPQNMSRSAVTIENNIFGIKPGSLFAKATEYGGGVAGTGVNTNASFLKFLKSEPTPLDVTPNDIKTFVSNPSEKLLPHETTNQFTLFHHSAKKDPVATTSLAISSTYTV
jgi:hypothetical protein